MTDTFAIKVEQDSFSHRYGYIIHCSNFFESLFVARFPFVGGSWQPHGPAGVGGGRPYVSDALL